MSEYSNQRHMAERQMHERLDRSQWLLQRVHLAMLGTHLRRERMIVVGQCQIFITARVTLTAENITEASNKTRKNVIIYNEVLQHGKHQNSSRHTRCTADDDENTTKESPYRIRSHSIMIITATLTRRRSCLNQHNCTKMVDQLE